MSYAGKVKSYSDAKSNKGLVSREGRARFAFWQDRPSDTEATDWRKQSVFEVIPIV